jgi:hypothetical protein
MGLLTIIFSAHMYFIKYLIVYTNSVGCSLRILSMVSVKNFLFRVNTAFSGAVLAQDMAFSSCLLLSKKVMAMDMASETVS